LGSLKALRTCLRLAMECNVGFAVMLVILVLGRLARWPRWFRVTMIKLSAASLSIVFAVLAVLPSRFGLTVNNYLLQAALRWLCTWRLLCLNIVGGYMGYPSFGTAAFFGLGAYLGAIAQGYGAPSGVAWIPPELVLQSSPDFSAAFCSDAWSLFRHWYDRVVEVMREIANNWEVVTGGATGLNLPIMHGTPRSSACTISS